jgi:LysM repeat protein/murein endopeptidase
MLERTITLRVRKLPQRAAAWLAVIAMSSFTPAMPTASAAAAMDRVHYAAGAAANNTPDAATERKPERKWVTHTIVPRESLDEIAARYDVKPSEIQAWNKKTLGSGGLKAGRDLRILARRPAPPRKKIKYTVVYGDTWGEIATKFNIDADDLRAWNKAVPKQFKAGQVITVYTNPRPPKISQVGNPNLVPGENDDVAVGLQPDALPVIDVRKGGISIGRPTRGKLYNGVQLPDTDYYDVRRPEEAWGSTHTVQAIQTALATFRRDSGYDGKIIVASLSKQNGGRFRPHRSHQSGRDADIRLPKKRGADLKSDDPNDIDWEASWKMIDAFIDTGEVEYIFLDYSRQKRLYDAARKLGVKSDELEKAIQYPRARKTNNGVVRHAEGHMVHIHVRIECPDDQARCES